MPWRPTLVPVRALRLVLGIGRTTSYDLARSLEPVHVGTRLRLPVDAIRRRFGDDVAEAVIRASEAA
jgi:hypothetical protein